MDLCEVQYVYEQLQSFFIRVCKKITRSEDSTMDFQDYKHA